LFGIEDIESGNRDKLGSDAMEERFGKNEEKFDLYLWDNVTDADGNGAFCSIMNYEPIEEEVAV